MSDFLLGVPGKLKALQDDVDTLTTNLQTVDDEISAIDTVVDRIEVDTNSIETKVDTVDGVVDTILVDTAAMQPQVNTINTRIDTSITSRASAASLQTVDNEIAAMQSDIDAIPTTGIRAVVVGSIHDVSPSTSTGIDTRYYDITSISGLTTSSKCVVQWWGGGATNGDTARNLAGGSVVWNLGARMINASTMRVSLRYAATMKFSGQYTITEYY